MEREMEQTIDELTIAYEENGIEVIKELDKVILTKGAWSTLLFRYTQWDKQKAQYSPEKFSLRRYQKRSGTYQLKSKFSISSKEQALKIINALSLWTAD